VTKRQIFHSFHFDNDVMRVQLVRNIGAVEGNASVSLNAWEEVRRKGRTAVEQWIDENMRYRSCVVVLVGTETHKRPFVQYEIEKAWRDGKGLFGIHIHNLNCPNFGTCSKGINPFGQFTFSHRGTQVVPKCYDPSSRNAYGDINANMAEWVEAAIAQRL
jgi:hypothetical protein